MDTRTKIIGLSMALLLFMAPDMVFSQKGVVDGSRYGQGQDSIDCRVNYSLYREYARQNAFQDAVRFWRRCFNDCPRSNTNLYIDGVRMYKDFADKEIDLRKKEQFIDTIMLIYNQRIQYGMGDEGTIRQYQGLDLFTLRTDDPASLKKAHGYLKSAVQLLKDKAIDPAYTSFIKISIMLYNRSELEAEEVLNDYLMVSDILETKKSDDLKASIDRDMVESTILNCELIIGQYTPRFEANPNDKALVVNITNFLDRLRCIESDLYYKALISRHNIEPTAQSAKMLAALSIKNKAYNEAMKYAQEAINSETNKDVMADLYLILADVTAKNGNFSLARTHANKSIELNPRSGQPYIFIGNLYANSTDLCSDLNLVRSIYWVAVDKFVRARQVDPSVTSEANRFIEIYSQYYPNKEEAFFNTVKEGDTYRVGCWINETTIARF